MDQPLISVIEIADAHGNRRQSIHQLVKRLGKDTYVHHPAPSYVGSMVTSSKNRA